MEKQFKQNVEKALSGLPFSDTETQISYRVSKQADLPKLLEIEHEWPEEIRATKEQIRRRLELFAEGTILAIDKTIGKIVGSIACQRLLLNPSSKIHELSWDNSTDFENMTFHNPNGNVLEAMALVVHPEYRGKGIGQMLLLFATKVASTMSPKIEIVSSNVRVPLFREWYFSNNGELADNEYIESMDEVDPVLKLHIRAKGKIVKIIKGQKSDQESLGRGVRFDHSEMMEFFRVNNTDFKSNPKQV